jgi:hypothetical protein
MRSRFFASLLVGLSGLAALAVVVPGPGGSRAQELQRNAREMPELRKLLLETPEVDAQKIVESLPDAKASAARKKEIIDEMIRLSVLEILEPPSPSGARGTFAAPLMSYLEWSDRRLQLDTSLAEGDEAKTKLLAAEVVRFRAMEDVYRELVKASTVSVTPRNLMELEYRRLELENLLREATTKAP